MNAAADATRLEVRAFGTAAADLAIDFRDPDRVAIAVAVATCCASGSGTTAEDSWWQRPITDRIAALLRITARTEGGAEIAVEFTCPDCGETFAADLPAGPIADLADSAPATVRGATATLRRPTGRDQIAWRSLAPESGSRAARAVAASLVVAGELPDDEASLAALSTAFAEADVLNAFRVSATCPHCAVSRELPVDLEAVALARLAAVQRRLLHDIHVLARHYGWSEATIVALPAWRRRHYLGLIDDEPGGER